MVPFTRSVFETPSPWNLNLENLVRELDLINFIFEKEYTYQELTKDNLTHYEKLKLRKQLLDYIFIELKTDSSRIDQFYKLENMWNKSEKNLNRAFISIIFEYIFFGIFYVGIFWLIVVTSLSVAEIGIDQTIINSFNWVRELL